jgi:hypothetical protein
MKDPQITARLPTAQVLMNPTLDTIYQTLETPDPAFWSVGSGDTGIERRADDSVGQLVVIGKSPHGFFVQHADPMGSNEYVAISSRDYSKRTSVVVGAEPWIIPVAFFIDSKSMRKAVAEFIASGKRSGELTWVKLWDQHWNADPL